MLWLRKLWAFLVCDFQNERSYKFAFITQFFGIFFSVLTFYFLSKLVGGAAASHLGKYGGDYLSFVLLGVALSDYVAVSLTSFAENVRSAQTVGTFEPLLATQSGVSTVILGSSLYSFSWTTFRVCVYILLGSSLFGLSLGEVNLISGAAIMLLTITAFSSLGLLSASFIIIFKKGDPISWLFMGASGALSGILYPVSVLPNWVQRISYCLPLTYAVDGLRRALLTGASLAELGNDILFLATFTGIMGPLALFTCKAALRVATRDGTLTHY